MHFLLLAILSSALISTVMRLSERRIRNKLGMLCCNYLACALLSALSAGNPFSAAEGMGSAVLLGVISGALYLGAFVLLQWNIGLNGVTLPATFMKLGVLVPTVLALTVFHESPRAAQLVGILLSLAAIVLIQSGADAPQATRRWGLPLLLLAGGLADAMSKVYEVYGAQALQARYLFFTFGVALVLCLALCFLKKQTITLPDALFGVLVGVPNYFSSRFLLQSLSDIPAVVAYPTFSVGTIVLVTLAARALFGERLTRRQLASLALILCALALLNV